LHRRVKKTEVIGAATSTRDYYYSDSWQVLEERVPSFGGPIVNRQFIWGLRYIDDLIRRDRYSSGSINETRFAMQDANFNVTVVTDSSGAVQERYRYDAYGTVTALNPSTFAPTGNPPANDWETLYCGYRWDATTGFYHVRHRTYHPALGRWMQRDPIGYMLRDLSLYAYCRNRAISTADPMGLVGPDDGPLDPPVNIGPTGPDSLGAKIIDRYIRRALLPGLNQLVPDAVFKDDGTVYNESRIQRLEWMLWNAAQLGYCDGKIRRVDVAFSGNLIALGFTFNVDDTVGTSWIGAPYSLEGKGHYYIGCLCKNFDGKTCFYRAVMFDINMQWTLFDRIDANSWPEAWRRGHFKDRPIRSFFEGLGDVIFDKTGAGYDIQVTFSHVEPGPRGVALVAPCCLNTQAHTP
jgi:RHS repeat-associated protein